MPLTQTISEFTTYPILDTSFINRVQTLKDTILALLPLAIVYTERNNYTKVLNAEFRELLMGNLPFSSVVCLISVVKPNSAIPYHIDNDRLISLNIPLQNTENLSIVHTITPPAASEITNVNFTLDTGETVVYPAAFNFISSDPINVSANSSLMVNVARFYSMVNASPEPAIYLSFRILKVHEHAAFDYFASM